MEIKKLENLNADITKRWESFVQNHPNGNFFQAPAAYQFFSGVEGYAPVMIYAEEENNIKGILSSVIIKELGIKGYFSRRCIVYGGPIVKEDEKEITDNLLKELINLNARKTIYIEFRNLFDLSLNKELFKINGFEYKDHYNFNLEILSLENNLKKLNKTRRWEINKSIKEGAEIVEAKELSDVKEFYAMLKSLYIKKVKKPLPEFSFFEQFFSLPTLGKYFLVKYEGKTIGGTMCPIFRDTIYEWYECSLDKEYKNIYPGSLATWAPIEYAAKNGLKYFDFMGAGKPDEDYGVRDFKSKFGGQLVNYGRYQKIYNVIVYSLAAKSYLLVKKLIKKKDKKEY